MTGQNQAEHDVEGHTLEDPSSTLAYAQPRDADQVSNTSHETVSAPPQRSSVEVDLERNERLSTEKDERLSSENHEGSSASTLHDSNSDAELAELRKTRTEIHGKDAEGRYIISWNGDQDPDNP